MKPDFAAAMRRATLLVRDQNLLDATRVIQDALGGEKAFGPPHEIWPESHSEQPSGPPALRAVEGNGTDGAGPSTQTATPGLGSGNAQEAWTALHRRWRPRTRRALSEVLAVLQEGQLRTGLGPLPGMGPAGLELPGLARSTPPPVPAGAQFVTRSFACAHGAREYKLYIPASVPTQPRGLVVMLHGCKQNPNDFARGTNMNEVAEAHGMLVAYPAQSGAANASRCWNWFNPDDQHRDAGEPAILAGITREIMAEFHLDRQGVFVAGLSAGGAMAAVMGETYPDLYAAVGIHSGLAYGSAEDVVSAFAAMRGGAGSLGPTLRGSTFGPRVRKIVFHGSADTIVHPSNADDIVAAARCDGPGYSLKRDQVHFADSAAIRTTIVDENGVQIVEYWMVDGVGHAWCGGDPTGSYTDCRGPDASAEMVRFFLSAPTLQ